MVMHSSTKKYLNENKSTIMVLPGMSDGRLFTTYVSACNLNDNMKKTLQLNTNSQYTEHLQKHADELLKDINTTFDSRVNQEQWWKTL